jgi:hypothetical protein
MNNTELGITVLSYSSAILTVVASTSKRGAEYVKALGVRADIFGLVGLLVGAAYFADVYGFEAGVVRQAISLFITVAISGPLVPYIVGRLCGFIKKDTKSCGVPFRLAVSSLILFAFIIVDSFIGDVVIQNMGKNKSKPNIQVISQDTTLDSQVITDFKKRLNTYGSTYEERDLEITMDATPPPK